MLSRRDLVRRLAVGTAGAAVALTAGGVGSAVASTRRGGATGADGHLGGHGQNWPANDGITGPATSSIEAASGVLPGAEQVKETSPAAVTVPPPWDLLRPLAPGTVLVHGWRVADLSSPADGACVLTLQNERGRMQRVHLCRNDGTPRGLVCTERFDLVVMNGGQGDLGTDEEFAQAVAKVAHAIAANERALRHEPVMTALLSHQERLERFAADSECWSLR
jgi:hypothetical protein